MPWSLLTKPLFVAITASLVTLAISSCTTGRFRTFPIPLAGVVPPDPEPGRSPPWSRIADFGLLGLRLPSSEITVLAESQPVRMRATAIEFMPVLPQGRDSVQFLGRRILLVWSEAPQPGHSDAEYFVVGGAHMPAALSPEAHPRCCDVEEMRQLRREPSIELAMAGERMWWGVDGVVTIHPPVLRKQCEPALEKRLDGLGVMKGGCRRATFDVALDASLKQYPGDVAGPVRYRAIAPTRVKGVQFLVDCLDPNEGSLAFLCRLL